MSAQSPDRIDSPLYVVTTVFNPVRFRSRWEHYRHFARHITHAGAKLVTVEIAFGERAHALPEHAPDTDGHRYVRLRVGSDSEVWLKENAQNIGVACLPPEWRYVAFLDADMTFARADIVEGTLHALQHLDVVQMYSHIISAGPNHEPLGIAPSFGYQHVHGLRGGAPAEYSGVAGKSAKGARVFGAPGGAWAWRRSAFEGVGQLIDFAILGAADYYMALALVGEAAAIDPRFTQGYREPILTWQERACSAIGGNIGYLDGTVWHHFHGSYADRRYGTRAQILIRNAFDPARDLKRDWQGVIALAGNKPRLRDDIREYFRARNEDATEARAGDYTLAHPKPAPHWRGR